MISEEVILERDRIECLIRELGNAIKREQVCQVKIRFTEDRITIIPHCQPVEIAR